MEELLSQKVASILNTDDLECLKSINQFKFDDQSETTKIFLDKLFEKYTKTEISKRYFKDSLAIEKYTLMQYSTKHNLKALVKALLDKDIDPNYVQEGVENHHRRKLISSKSNAYNVAHSSQNLDSKNCETPPILIAAENGNYQLLKIFKYHNFSCLLPRHQVDEVIKEEDEVPLKNSGRLSNNVNFSVVHARLRN